MKHTRRGGAPRWSSAKLAYQLFRRRFSGPRWDALAARGAQLQRPLWASTPTKDAAYPYTLYVDGLVGRDTIKTLPEATSAAFEDHGALATTIDTDIDDAQRTLYRLEAIGVSMTDIGRTLEDEGIASFTTSFDDLLATLETQRAELSLS